LNGRLLAGLLQDLTAIGVTQPGVRKRLTSAISKLSIADGIPPLVPVCRPFTTHSCLAFKVLSHRIRGELHRYSLSHSMRCSMRCIVLRRRAASCGTVRRLDARRTATHRIRSEACCTLSSQDVPVIEDFLSLYAVAF